MTTEALRAAGLDPTGIAGGRVDAWGSNLHAGSNALYVVEADEYDRSFLALTPTVAVVLNVEADHLDIYRDLGDITSTFTQFMQPSRSVVLCSDDAGALSLPQDATRELVRYSAHTAQTDPSPHARLIAHDVMFVDGGSRSRIAWDGKPSGELVLRVPGMHNVRNALAALGAGLMIGARVEQMLPGLEQFRGVERRFQRLGERGGALVIDDYAHHPTEVAATLSAARAAYPTRRLVVAFQPHLYSRTRDFADAFGAALATADVCLLCDIYPAREQPIEGVSSELIAAAMRTHGRGPVWQGPRADGVSAIEQLMQPDDVIVTMGAGDITRVGHELVARGAA
jgi:UDP-N-acetylmuramate--alanine ligase